MVTACFTLSSPPSSSSMEPKLPCFGVARVKGETRKRLPTQESDIPAFLWSKSERTQPLPEDQWATVLLKCKATTGGKDWMARWVGGSAQQPHF